MNEASMDQRAPGSGGSGSGTPGARGPQGIPGNRGLGTIIIFTRNNTRPSVPSDGVFDGTQFSATGWSTDISTLAGSAKLWATYVAIFPDNTINYSGVFDPAGPMGVPGSTGAAGAAGQDGADGQDGAAGSAGPIGRGVDIIFTRSATRPALPTGGSWDGTTYRAPPGWFKDREPPGSDKLWAAYVRLNSDNTVAYELVFDPVGPQGPNGPIGDLSNVTDRGVNDPGGTSNQDVDARAQVLIKTHTSSGWEPHLGPDLFRQILANPKGMGTPGPATDDVVKFNGTNWVFGPPASRTSSLPFSSITNRLASLLSGTRTTVPATGATDTDTRLAGTAVSTVQGVHAQTDGAFKIDMDVPINDYTDTTAAPALLTNRFTFVNPGLYKRTELFIRWVPTPLDTSNSKNYFTSFDTATENQVVLTFTGHYSNNSQRGNAFTASYQNNAEGLVHITFFQRGTATIGGSTVPHIYATLGGAR